MAVKGLRIHAVVEGTRLDGEIVAADPSGLQVKIVSPYEGVTGWDGFDPLEWEADFPEKPAPYFVRDGELTPKGAETGERILVEVFRGCVLFSNNLETLKAEFVRLCHEEGDAKQVSSRMFDHIKDRYQTSIPFITLDDLIAKFLLLT